jgi:ERCC4-related helicase
MPLFRPVIKARAYQIGLLDEALKENVIVFLDTGAGKTYIAALLIKVCSSHHTATLYNSRIYSQARSCLLWFV